MPDSCRVHSEVHSYDIMISNEKYQIPSSWHRSRKKVLIYDFSLLLQGYPMMHPYDSRMVNDYSGITRSKYSSGDGSKQLQELIQERVSCVTVRRGCVKCLAVNLLCKNYHEQTRSEWLKNHEMATRQICTGFPDLNISLASINKCERRVGGFTPDYIQLTAWRSWLLRMKPTKC